MSATSPACYKNNRHPLSNTPVGLSEAFALEERLARLARSVLHASAAVICHYSHETLQLTAASETSPSDANILAPAIRTALAGMEDATTTQSVIVSTSAGPLLIAPLERNGACRSFCVVAGEPEQPWSFDDQVTLDELVEPFRELLALRSQFEVQQHEARKAREHAQFVDAINRVAQSLAAEFDLERIVQVVTDTGTELTGAQFGAFFYNVVNDRGEAYTLYTLSGVPREAFASFPMPRNTAVFQPTFTGEGVVRLDDVTADPRYGLSAPYHGMPKGHLPVRSYLAVPVTSRSGEVIGGLFFGHERVGVFNAEHERLLVSIAAQAAVAVDNARLYQQTLGAERRFRDLINGVEAVFWEADPATLRFTFVSDRAQSLLGYPVASWLESSDFWPGLILPEDRERVLTTLRRELAEDHDLELEYRVRTAAGEELWLRQIIYLVHDAGGAVAQLRGVLMDVTERRRKETAMLFLTEASTLLASSLDYETTLSSVARLAVPDIADWCAVDLISENEGLQRLAVAHIDPEKVRLAYQLRERYPEDRNAPRGLYQVLRTGEPDMMSEIPQEFLEAGARDAEHLEIIRDLGLVSYIIMPLVARGRTLGAISMVTAESKRHYGPDDLALAREIAQRAAIAIDNARLFRDTQQAEALQARRAQESALVADVGVALNQSGTLKELLTGCTAALVQHIGAAFARIWTLDPSGTLLELQSSSGIYTHINGGHARVPVGAYKIGRIAQSRMPHLSNDVTHDPEVGDPEWAAREGMVAFAGYPLTVEGRLVGVMALFARSVLAEDTLSALAAIADIVAQGVERKRVEEEIHRLNTSLERRVRERTAALLDANQELESFSYSVSHDLRAPLRHIAGFADLLRKRSGEQLDEAGQRYLHTIQDSARHAGHLVDDLLAFSRMGRTEMRQQPVDMRQLALQAKAECERETEDRQITWEIGPLPSVEGDASMLRQVWRNLLSNAAKYTRQRAGAVIQVRGSLEGDRVVYTVTDNGVGFDPRYVDKLFGVFQRLHSNDEFEGTGIGLANVRRIVQRHGGRVWAEGKVGEGATFYFELPTHSGPAQSPAQLQSGI